MRPCPFCHSYHASPALSGTRSWVFCPDCGARGPVVDLDDSGYLAQWIWDQMLTVSGVQCPECRGRRWMPLLLSEHSASAYPTRATGALVDDADRVTSIGRTAVASGYLMSGDLCLGCGIVVGP